MMAYEMEKYLKKLACQKELQILYLAQVRSWYGNDRTSRCESDFFYRLEETGSKVAELGGRHLKKVSLEMGGKNAVIVMDDADLNLAVEGILWSAFGTAGQRCTACSRVIVHKDVKE